MSPDDELLALDGKVHIDRLCLYKLLAISSGSLRNLSRIIALTRIFQQPNMPAATIPFESESVRRVHSMLHDKVNKTPVLVSKTLSDVASVLLGSQQITQKCGPRIELFFKCENMQKTGSFKYRGAMNSILGLSDDELKRGLITTSSGTIFSVKSDKS